MNCNPIPMMKHFAKHRTMISSTEKPFGKHEMVVQYVMIIDGENRVELLENYSNKKTMIMFGTK